MGRRSEWMVALSLALAGCFTDNGGAASGPGAPTSAETTGDPGVTTAGATSEDSSASTCASACGGPSDPTIPGSTGTGDATTGGPTTEDTAGETTTGGARPMFTPGVNLFLTGAFALATGRYDDDGLDDLVITSNDLMKKSLYVVHGPGNGPYGEFDTVTGISVAAPDLDGDGDSDIVVGEPGTPAVVYTFTWDAGVTIGPAIQLPDNCIAPRELALGHLNGDMHVDLVVACEAAGLVILPGVNGAFGNPLQLATGGTIGGVELLDVNGDAQVDVVYLDGMNDSAVVIRGSGILNLDANKAVSFQAEEPIAVAGGDLDGDAFADFVVATGKGSCLAFRGGPDAPSAGPIYGCGPAALDIQLADLDADGLDDVVTVHSEDLRVGFGVGDGSFIGPDTYKVGQTPARAAVGDFDGDGRPDVAVTGQNALMLFLQYG